MIKEPINQSDPETGKLDIIVDKSVVSHLSLGLYRNFARAVKELISNSYDASATEVKIKLDLKKKLIIIRDNGKGMDLKEIKEKFLTIGRVSLPSDEIDEMGRKKVGNFGIGCLSVFPYCTSLHLLTKKKGQEDIIELNIDTSRFFNENTSSIDVSNISQEKVNYKKYLGDLELEQGETIITMKGIKPHLVKDLMKRKSSGISTIDKFEGYEKFKWTLSQYAPIQFPPERKDLRDFFSIEGLIPLRVFLEGKEIFRNVPKETEILEMGEKRFDEVHIKYVIMTPMKPVEPSESRGLQLRLRGVSIGLPRDFDVTKKGRVLGKLNYLCGEISILSGLGDSLMINRDSFSYTQQVADLEEFFREKLTKYTNQLEKWAEEDKEVYEALIGVRGADKMIKSLKNAGFVHIPKERVRLSKPSSPFTNLKENLPDKIYKILSKNKEFSVLFKSEETIENSEPVVVNSKEKSITISKSHPKLKEYLNIKGKKLGVQYKHLGENKKFPIAKLSENGKEIIFNINNPLFHEKNNLDSSIIKKLSAGFLLITRGKIDREGILKQLDILLEEIFLKGN